MSNKIHSLIAEAKSFIQTGISTIRDGLNPRASGFDHLNRKQIAQAQMSHLHKALTALEQVEVRLERDIKADSVSLEQARQFSKNFDKLFANSEGMAPDVLAALCASQDILLMGILSSDPFALKEERPEPAPEGMAGLFPNPAPYTGFAPCKACDCRIVLLIPMQRVECARCSACFNTPSEWMAENAPDQSSAESAPC